MSRIGKKPVILPQGVTVESSVSEVTVKSGGKSLQVPLWPHLSLQKEADRVSVTRERDDKRTRSFHGLCRSLIQNAVTGLSKGWSKSLSLSGVGYKARVAGGQLELHLGFSHPISVPIPQGIDMKVEKQTLLTVTGADRELVGRTAQGIRALRPPEPYLGKGVKYTDEVLRRKAGKSGGDKK